MSNNKSNRRRLVYSVISLILCISMLLGTTLAWFTDSVSSTGNIIKSGKLDVAMHYAEHKDGEWKDASDAAIFDGGIWEPGYSEMKFIRVSNTGNLAFSYQMHILPAVEAEGDVDLAEVIDVYVGLVDDNFTEPAAFSTQMEGMTKVDTLAELMDKDAAMEGILLPTKGAAGVLPDGVVADTGDVTFCVVLHMQEDAPNKYQNLTVGNNFSIQLVATQYDYEKAEFGGYDGDSRYDGLTIPGIKDEAVAEVTVNADQELTEEVTLEGDVISAEVPAGVKLADGVEELTLTVDTIEQSEANITLDKGESMVSLDVHMEGVAEDNTVPMLITLEKVLPAGLYDSNVALYHVENGATVEMTKVALEELDKHNEYYYNAATGDVTLALASFSEIAVAANLANPWDGTVATELKGSGTEADPYKISDASELAYFRNLVDGGNSFKGEYVTLTDDINLEYYKDEIRQSFDPIGWGYANESHNRKDANNNSMPGRTFDGTFDGDGHTIYNLYQNGWDLEEATGTDYTYTNCGFGLFAAASGATFKNLTISGADIRVECVEAGILVGLSQNDCTYDNIKIYNSKIANYQRPAGGLIGEVSGTGTTTISNVTIGSDVVVGSMWGDFDAPVGGVIGARWDDDAVAKDPLVDMKNVTVACKLDVYNDITSTYQWHAYRRAGMLIGNTDTPPADGKNAKTATADFLTCEMVDGKESVVVNYGPWVNYHYCEFSEEYNSPSWPFVRVEAGENCSAFSNPRWGVAKDSNGNPITTASHTPADHTGDDEHNVKLPFNQLYGGGQGVYGQPEHDGVNVVNYAYSITYKERNEILHVEYVSDNSKAILSDDFYKIPGLANDAYQWVNAGSSVVSSIPANNESDITLYLDRADVYLARFLYQDGTVYKAIEFNNQTGKLKEAKPAVPDVNGLVSVGWETYTLMGAKGDVSIKPIYTINDYVQLNPVDTDGDGVTNYYEVVGSNIPANNTDITIPEAVNGIKVTHIMTGAFANGGLRDVFVPNSIEMLGENAFCKDHWREYPQIQIVFDGTKEEWDALVKASENAGNDWDDNIGNGSTIVCLREPGRGYFKQTGKNGVIGIGTSTNWEWQSGSYPTWFTDRYQEKYPHLFA